MTCTGALSAAAAVPATRQTVITAVVALRRARRVQAMSASWRVKSQTAGRSARSPAGLCADGRNGGAPDRPARRHAQSRTVTKAGRLLARRGLFVVALLVGLLQRACFLGRHAFLPDVLVLGHERIDLLLPLLALAAAFGDFEHLGRNFV